MYPNAMEVDVLCIVKLSFSLSLLLWINHAYQSGTQPPGLLVSIVAYNSMHEIVPFEC